MMAATIIWIYGARLVNIPERRHKVKGCNSFAFSDLRHIITKAALSKDFDAVCHRHPNAIMKITRVVGKINLNQVMEISVDVHNDTLIFFHLCR